MTLGPRTMERCSNVPTVVATEIKPGDDGARGSMSLCDECRAVFVRKYPRRASFRKVGS